MRRRTAFGLVLMTGVVAGCGSHEHPRSDSARAAPPGAGGPVNTVVAPAESALARYLESVRAGHAGSRAAADSLLGCQIGDGMYQPIETLGSFRLLGAAPAAAGDTVVSRAEVVTVAEEDGSPTSADRFVAVQRVRRDTVTYRLTHDSTSGRWVLCTGPQYGRWGSDDKTDWRPRGASEATAGALADSVWRAEHATSSRPGT